MFCREHEAFTDRQKVPAAAKRVLPDFPDRVLALLPQTTYIFDDCATWDVGRADARVSVPARSDVPALLMSGALDGATPPSSADVAATGLPNSRTLVFPGLGHAVIGSECPRTTLVAFLNQPTGDYDTSCVDNLTVPPFATGLRRARHRRRR